MHRFGSLRHSHGNAHLPVFAAGNTMDIQVYISYVYEYSISFDIRQERRSQIARGEEHVHFACFRQPGQWMEIVRLARHRPSLQYITSIYASVHCTPSTMKKINAIGLICSIWSMHSFQWCSFDVIRYTQSVPLYSNYSTIWICSNHNLEITNGHCTDPQPLQFMFSQYLIEWANLFCQTRRIFTHFRALSALTSSHSQSLALFEPASHFILML